MTYLNQILVTTFPEDTALLTTYKNPVITYFIVLRHLDDNFHWGTGWKIKINVRSTVFALNHGYYPQVFFNNKEYLTLTSDEVLYLGFHLDKRLTWRIHIGLRKLLDKQYGLISRINY